MLSKRMASVHPLPVPPVGNAAPPTAGGAPETVSERGLIPAPPSLDEGEPIQLSAPIARLPVELDVAVPAREFRVRNLLALEPGQVIETEWTHGEDMPLAAGNVPLAWSEFEVVDSQLAVRITRLV
jgi:flagellar motor switch/type III secretory pathway protein FliN